MSVDNRRKKDYYFNSKITTEETHAQNQNCLYTRTVDRQ